jgi:hypothetical protein
LLLLLLLMLMPMLMLLALTLMDLPDAFDAAAYAAADDANAETEMPNDACCLSDANDVQLLPPWLVMLMMLMTM